MQQSCRWQNTGWSHSVCEQPCVCFLCPRVIYVVCYGAFDTGGAPLLLFKCEMRCDEALLFLIPSEARPPVSQISVETSTYERQEDTGWSIIPSSTPSSLIKHRLTLSNITRAEKYHVLTTTNLSLKKRKLSCFKDNCSFVRTSMGFEYFWMNWSSFSSFYFHHHQVSHIKTLKAAPINIFDVNSGSTDYVQCEKVLFSVTKRELSANSSQLDRAF